MKKICIFNGDMSRGGGTERITQVLANLLSQNTDYSVIVLNLNNEKNESYYPLTEGVCFYTLKSNGIKNKIFELRKYLRKEKVDIIINVDIMLGIYSIPASFFTKTKVVSWEMFNLRNDIGSRHTKLIRKICLWYSAYYVNQTKGDMEAFVNEMPVKCPITYIYNPCEIDYSYTDYDVNSKTIVTAGHFFYTKGYDLAVEVAKIVFERHPDWKWEFYGDGTQLENIKKQVADYNLEKNIVFCGRTNDIISAYKKASMYVMTSRTEGFGLVLTEAKSCNLPTLAFDIDFGPREIIDNNVSGFLVNDFNIEEMAKKICFLIDNESKRVEFSQHSKDNCKKFSSEEFLEGWLKIFEAI